jgi:signal transduction protein with GAF and PtsI domain
VPCHSPVSGSRRTYACSRSVSRGDSTWRRGRASAKRSGSRAWSEPSRIAAARGASGVAFESPAPDDASAFESCRGAKVPAICGTKGLFSSSRPGDLGALDGDEGVIHVSPSAAIIAPVRASQTPRATARVRRKAARDRGPRAKPR